MTAAGRRDGENPIVKGKTSTSRSPGSMCRRTFFKFLLVVVNVLTIFLLLSYLLHIYSSPKPARPCRFGTHNFTENILRAGREWQEFKIEYKAKEVDIGMRRINPRKILILLIVEENTDISQYVRAISTVDCYRRIHGYSFKIVNDKNYKRICTQKDKFFRRHCIAALLLKNYEYMLFIDADVGVVNPKRRIEEFLDDRYHVILYDRFHNPEVAAGSYIVRNTAFAKEFLIGFANYEANLKVDSFHGTDNGALHAYLADTVLGNSTPGYNYCIDMWHASRDAGDLFAYEYCIRGLLGQHEDFGKIKITNRYSGWIRDSWLTNSLWNPKMDFLLHGWKKHQYKNYTNCDLPIDITVKEPSRNIFPLVGSVQMDLCRPGNTTWNYDPNLIATEEDMVEEYRRIAQRVEENNIALMARIPRLLNLKYRVFE